MVRRPGEGRLVIGRVGRRLIAAEKRQSLIVFGPTQTGKTTGLAIPAILGGLLLFVARRKKHADAKDSDATEVKPVTTEVETAREAGQIRRGDLIAVLSGSKEYPGQATDTLRLIPIK